MIKDLFIIDAGPIKKFDSFNQDEDIIIYVRLKPKCTPLFCPVCGKKLSGNGTKEKPIKHGILIGRKCKLIYEARRYRCKKCNYSEFERSPRSSP